MNELDRFPQPVPQCPKCEEWKWEYENLCKFANDFEQQRDEARAELNLMKLGKESWHEIAVQRQKKYEEVHTERDEARAEVERLSTTIKNMRWSFSRCDSCWHNYHLTRAALEGGSK